MVKRTIYLKEVVQWKIENVKNVINKCQPLKLVGIVPMKIVKILMLILLKGGMNNGRDN